MPRADHLDRRQQDERSQRPARWFTPNKFADKAKTMRARKCLDIGHQGQKDQLSISGQILGSTVSQRRGLDRPNHVKLSIGHNIVHERKRTLRMTRRHVASEGNQSLISVLVPILPLFLLRQLPPLDRPDTVHFRHIESYWEFRNFRETQFRGCCATRTGPGIATDL